VTTGSATIQVSGVRCERCIGRLAGALRGHDGIEYANANLMGEVALQWDDDKTSRDEIVAVLRRSGFPERDAHSSSRGDRERDSARL
jgi:copper chaperone CopZ